MSGALAYGTGAIFEPGFDERQYFPDLFLTKSPMITIAKLSRDFYISSGPALFGLGAMGLVAGPVLVKSSTGARGKNLDLADPFGARERLTTSPRTFKGEPRRAASSQLLKVGAFTILAFVRAFLTQTLKVVTKREPLVKIALLCQAALSVAWYQATF
ncbi:MAG: hypothetical protein LBE80_11330 [Deltaproteobacteria bacterium]|nr:hypothetical protein [Deltaproteobacteria bacterium]